MGAPQAAVAEALDTGPPSSALRPLRDPVYRGLWLASVVSNLGTWMHEAAGAWLMTTLAPGDARTRARSTSRIGAVRHREEAMGPKSMPFDPKRMVYGGFTVLVDA
jgi:hypothetical protein